MVGWREGWLERERERERWRIYVELYPNYLPNTSPPLNNYRKIPLKIQSSRCELEKNLTIYFPKSDFACGNMPTY